MVLRLTHEHYRDCKSSLTGLAYDAKAIRVFHLVFESDLLDVGHIVCKLYAPNPSDTHHIGLLDCRPVCHRIREWDAKLNDVCPSLLHRKQDWYCVIGGGISRGDKGNQCRAGLGIQGRST